MVRTAQLQQIEKLFSIFLFSAHSQIEDYLISAVLFG